MSEDWWHLNTGVVLLASVVPEDGILLWVSHGPEFTRHLPTGGCICGFLAQHMAQDRYEYWEVFFFV